jgi:formamidopyrimidine-DNA glycosylase
MPELPEVETLKRGLEKYIIGHTILDIETRIPKIFQGEKQNIIGAKIIRIERIGKGLIIELDNEFVMAVHLKMTGQMIYQGLETKGVVLSRKAGGDLPSKFSHVIFTLDNEARLFYNDLRRFGWIKVLARDEAFQMAFFKEMGPEPIVDGIKEKNPLVFDKFKEVLSKSNISVKLTLMDQKKIGGIGNIYANEALFKAGIDPRRKGKEIREEEIKKLFKAISTVLEDGLKFGGSSDENFINVLGQEGEYQQHFLVYNRKGQKCVQCRGIIQKIQLGGRGTYYCEKCQK